MPTIRLIAIAATLPILLSACASSEPKNEYRYTSYKETVNNVLLAKKGKCDYKLIFVSPKYAYVFNANPALVATLMSTNKEFRSQVVARSIDVQVEPDKTTARLAIILDIKKGASEESTKEALRVWPSLDYDYEKFHISEYPITARERRSFVMTGVRKDASALGSNYPQAGSFPVKGYDVWVREKHLEHEETSDEAAERGRQNASTAGAMILAAPLLWPLYLRGAFDGFEDTKQSFRMNAKQSQDYDRICSEL